MRMFSRASDTYTHEAAEASYNLPRPIHDGGGGGGGGGSGSSSDGDGVLNSSGEGGS